MVTQTVSHVQMFSSTSNRVIGKGVRPHFAHLRPLQVYDGLAKWALTPFPLPCIAVAFLLVHVAGCGETASHGPLTTDHTPHTRAALFSEITDAAGVRFVHEAGERGRYYMMESMCSGVALFDCDGDGDLDIYAVNGCLLGEGGRPEVGGPSATADSKPVNRLLRQDSPGRFVDATEGSSLGDPGYGMGVAVGDVNNDGRPDLYVTNHGSDRLYVNLGGGRFRDVTAEAGIDNVRLGASAAFVDYDRDGWLDVVVTNYVDFYPARCRTLSGHGEDYCGPHTFNGTPDKLYHNELGRLVTNGEGSRTDGGVLIPRFSDVSLSSGIAKKRGRGLGVVCADFNGDRRPDIYVANDSQDNSLWINEGGGRFRESAVAFGCAGDALGRPQASMGVALGDVNGDERFDLFMTHLDGETNALYLSNRSGFEEAAVRSGLGAPSLPYTGFGTVFADVDHDGGLDLLLVNGRVRRADDFRGKHAPPVRDPRGDPDTVPEYWKPYAEPNQLFLNVDGSYREIEAGRDPFTERKEVTRGLAVGDIDNDGDLDVCISNTSGRLRLYRNDAPQKGAWLVVRAVDPALGGRDAYGAVIRVVAGGRTWQRLVDSAGSYLSAHDPRAHFGLGRTETIGRIVVDWPDGTSEEFPGGPPNRHIVLRRGEGRHQK